LATYDELRAKFADDAFRHRLEVAVCVKAHSILQEPSPSAGRLAWATAAFSGTAAEADRMLRYLLAANKDLTVAQIEAATDDALQTKADEAVDKMFA
jgi:hypothetical protein